MKTRLLWGSSRWLSLAVVLGSVLLSGQVFASDDMSRTLLDKMSRSYRELNYQGTFSYQHGSQIESLRIDHAVFDGREYERLEYLDGEQREIIRRGHGINCIHPGHKLVRFFQQQQLQGRSADQSGVGQYYLFKVVDSARIAGRKVINIEVRPKDVHRYGYLLSLDEETGLLLRSELKGDAGKILERFQFVEISIGGAAALEHFTGAERSYLAEHTEPEVNMDRLQVASDKSWMVNWLPRGFTSTVANLKFVSDDMVTFTDGLTVFSVFLEKDIPPEAMARGIEGRARRGATIAYSRALLLAGHPHRVTVVGEIPARTAQQVAQSVVLVGR